MVDRLGHSRLEHLCLEPALEEVLHGEGQNIIELVLVLVKEPKPVHPAQKGLSLKYPPWVFLVEGEEIPCSITDATQGILDPPELPLAPEPVLPNKLQLRVQTLLLIWTTGFLESLPIYRF